jgi:hypothetical protein
MHLETENRMCSDPITRDGNTFACRTCNECIATRRHGWVARAMAEKATIEHALCIALTYSDETEQSRDGARMFQYADVRDYMKRLREAAAFLAEKEGLERPVIRFLCAGEQGSRYGRCHWHLIIYSSVDLTRLGTFRKRGHLVAHRRDMITEGKRKVRLNWSLWPHGFVTLQEPDQGGMSYVLSYCLKDQFTVGKSKGTMREAKAEDFATGLFRMSKRPAIGEAFFLRKMENLVAQRQLLPSLNFTIPGFGGFYHPSGSFRQKVLWWLTAANAQIRWATGADAPQWSTLLAACADNVSDMEILVGTETEERSLEAEVSFNARWRSDEIRRATEARFRRHWRGCCDQCLKAAGDPVRALRHGDGWTFRTSETDAQAIGKASWLERGGAQDLTCETCGSVREVWAIQRQTAA